MWILFVFVLAGSAHDGVAVTQAEFSTKSTCTEAAKNLMALNDRIQAVCQFAGE